MSVMIKLRLPPAKATLDVVRQLPGLSGLQLDAGFGVLGINPADGLYVVRVNAVPDLDARRRLSPEIRPGACCW